jgi:hypothetical protein
MKNYNLNIADYKIKIESAEDGPELVPSERFAGYISSDAIADITIKVHHEGYLLPEGAERVFHAPLVEEVNGSQIKKDDNFWSICRHRSDLFIKTIFPYSASGKKAVLKFSLSDRQWNLFIEGAADSTDPLDYPLDGLILYYLSAINGDVMVHASGVNHAGNGYIFSGVSGKGKTTLAGLWNKAGARVVHDDRLIIRNIGGKFFMHNTPVYKNDLPSQSEISRIFLISHGKENRLVPVKGAGAVSLFLANCIQHNWNSELIARLIGSVSVMCSTIPVGQLSFKPDRDIIDFIMYYE